MLERRKNPRHPCSGVVTLSVAEGHFAGSSLVAILHDISAGGICVVLDGGDFTRGTAITVEFEDGLPLEAWVCHASHADGMSRIGLSFSTVDPGCPGGCFDNEHCQTVSRLVV